MSAPITPRELVERDGQEYEPVENIYKVVAGLSEQIKVPKLVAKEAGTFAVTNSGNVLISNFDHPGFQIYSMQAEKIFYSSDSGRVTAFHVTPSNSRFYIGYRSGLLECRVPNSLAVESELQLKSEVYAITSDDKVIYVTTKNGKIIYFKNFHMDENQVKVLKEDGDHEALKVLKLSPDNNFLVAYNDLDDYEEFYVFSTIKGEKVWQGVLDLHGGDLREDPEKLLVISDDSLNLYARSENSKGITMYSLFDGQKVIDTQQLHTNYIFQFLVSRDGKTVFSCGKDKKIKVWDWIKQQLKTILTFHSDTVESIALSHDEKLLFSGSVDQQIAIWSVKYQFHISTIMLDFPCRTVMLSDGNEYLIAHSKVGKRQHSKSICYWHVEKNEDAFRINVNLKGVNNTYVTPDNMYLALMSKQKVDIWNIQSRTLIQSHNLVAKYWLGLRTLNGTADSKYIFFQKEDSELIQWECESQSQVHTFEHSELLLDLVISSDDKYMYTNSEPTLYKWHLPTRQLITKYHHKTKNFLYTILSPDNRYIYSNCYGNEVYILDTTKDENQEMTSFDFIKVTAWLFFELAHDGEHFIQTGQFSGRMWIVNIKTKQIVKVVDANKSVIKQIAFTKDGKALLTKSETETVVWDAKTWNEIITIDEQFGIVTSTNRWCNALIHDDLYKLWKTKVLADFSDDYEVEEEEQQQDGEGTALTDRKKKLTLTGPYNQLAPLFIESMIKNTKPKQTEYINLLQKTVIQPHKLNLGHYFSYTNNYQSMQAAYKKKGKVQYLLDSKGKFPLQYAIQRKSHQCCSTVLEYIMKSDNNIYSKFNQGDIVELIDFSPKNLKDFFNKAIDVQERGVPSYAIIEREPMSFTLSKSPNLTSQVLRDLVKCRANGEVDEENKVALPVVFKSIKFSYNFEPGSSQSIKFLDRLRKLDNIETFRSQAIQVILQYKWLKVRFRAYILGAIFSLYLAALYVHIEFFEDSKSYTTPILAAFAIFYLLFEITQISIRRLAYVADFWTVFDFCRTILLVVFILLEIKDSEWQQNDLAAAVNLLSWLRGMSFLRMFKKTRVLINLLVQVMVDMIPFMIVLTAALLGFSITFTAIKADELETTADSLAHCYDMMYGNFTTENYNTAGWIIFVFASTLMTLVMLNMLIAIMSDTYARVKGEIVPSDFFELNNLILEQEEILFWKRRHGTPRFLHFAHYIGQKEDEEWEGAFAKMRNQAGGDDNDLEIQTKMNQKLDIIVDNQALQMRDTHVKFDEQKKRFDAIVESLRRKVAAKLLGN